MSIRILVVDDASFIRDMVKKNLRDRIPGVDIQDAHDGARALSLLKNQSFDLILSDWEMPNLSGEELLRNVRSQPQHAQTPFIMVSSRGDRNHVLKAVEAGVSDYLSKPFTPDELLRKVFKQLKRIGKEPVQPVRNSGNTQGIAFASVDVLTGGRSAEPSPAADAAEPAPARNASPAPANKSKVVKARAQLRFADNLTCGCVVRELSLQALSGLIPRGERLPALLEPAVMDIELGDSGEVARLNGYVHSLQAGEQKPETQVVKIVIRFVDQDVEKFELLSRFIVQM